MEDKEDNNEPLNNSESSAMDFHSYFDPIFGHEFVESEHSLTYSDTDSDTEEQLTEEGNAENLNNNNKPEFDGEESLSELRFANDPNNKSSSSIRTKFNTSSDSFATEGSRYDSDNENDDYGNDKADLNAFTQTQAPPGAENYTPPKKSRQDVKPISRQTKGPKP